MRGRNYLLAMVLAGSLRGGVAAQGEPPQSAPVAPDPSLCQVEARPIADFAAFLGTPPAATASPPAALGAKEVTVPEGEPADAATIEAVTATIHTYYACRNGNDLLRAFTLLTDDGFDRALTLTGMSEKELAFLAETPGPTDKRDWEAVAISEVVILPDQRVAARIDGIGVGETFRGIVLLVPGDDRYRIDELTIVHDALPGKETPPAKVG